MSSFRSLASPVERAAALTTPSQTPSRALHLVTELAERADRSRRHLPAARALVQHDAFGSLERRARLVEKSKEEVVLRAGRDVLEPVQDLLVRDRRRALGERAFLDDVIDLA